MPSTSESELKLMARERESAADAALSNIQFDDPGMLQRYLRNDLAIQADLNRVRRSDDKIVQIETKNDTQALICKGLEFKSGSRLEFDLELEKYQVGWIVKRFRFSLFLTGRPIQMLRIHLNGAVGHDPIRVARCHIHIDNSDPHIPFPIMNPRLLVHFICEHIEPHLAIEPVLEY